MHKQFLYYAQLMRLEKPIGIFLLLWPTLMALWISGKGAPNVLTTLIFIAGTVVMRSAGCVINDLCDRKFDGSVARTSLRPLVVGKVSPFEAWIIFFALIIIAFILALQLNQLAIQLSFIALFLAVIYPLVKRYHHFPQLVLGAAFGIAIPMAFAAIQEVVPVEAYILYVATLFWVLAYDTQYAMVDREDDIKIGIKSTAIYFGKQDYLFVLLSQCISLLLFSYVGYALSFGFYYFIGIFIASCLMLYQQFLIYDRIPAQCFKAFLNNNYFGMAIFLGIVIEYKLLSSCAP